MVRHRAVGRVVALGVVGVDGVARVGGDADRAGERPRAVVVRAAPACRSTARGSRRAAGRPRRCRPSLPFSSWSNAARTGMYGRSGEPAAAASAAVPACTDSWLSSRRGGQELLVAAEVRGRLHVVGHQVPADDRRRLDPRLLGDEPDQRRPRRPRRGPRSGCVCRCRSNWRPFLPMDRSRWMASCGTRSSGRSTATRRVGPVAQRDTAGQAEVAVEPAVEQRPAVDLHGDLPPAVRAGVRERLDPQVRRVGVRADDPERGSRGARAPGRTRRRSPRRAGRSARPPRRSQASVSATCRNPAFSRRSAELATAWYGDGLAAMKSARSSVWPRSKRDWSFMRPRIGRTGLPVV